MQPVAISTKTKKEVEKVVLFTIDDKEYLIPTEVPAGLMIQFMRESKEDPTQAGFLMLEKLLGKEAYRAIEGCEQLTMAQFTEIIENAVEIISGDLPKA